jgi:serine/threonine protein kinase
MSTYTSEPGTRLAGRYRLVDQVTAGNGWTMWKAIDETLARPVAVLTFAAGFPRVSQVVTAARAASRLTDPRMAQVFDVEDGGGQAYIVFEWVAGDTLTDLLTDGPLEPGRACSLISEAARALAGAHAVGQAHLRLTPDALCWTRSSGIKITGLGIDAALAGDGLTGPAAHDPAIADTIALAGLLYAALTGYWPGEEPTRLPAAPVSDGAVCTPRQVSADVSSAIDSVIVRGLLQRTTRQGGPILSPAEFADAIASVAPPVPLPEPAPSAPSGYSGRGGDRGYRDYPSNGYPANPNDPDTWQSPGPQGTSPYPERRQSAQFPSSGGGYRGGQYEPAPYQGPERRGTSRALMAVVVVLVLVVIAAIVWAVGFRQTASTNAGGSGGSGGGGTGATHSKTGHSATATAAVLKPAGVTTFNPLGNPAGNTEDPSTAINAIEDNGSPWATSDYFGSPAFAGLKTGTGLLIDMGKEVNLSQVMVQFGAGTTKAEIYLGNSGPSLATSTNALSSFQLVSGLASATGKHTFQASSGATGRYVLIWLTSLPPALNPPASIVASAKGQKIYEGLIYDVVVRGTAVSAAH